MALQDLSGQEPIVEAGSGRASAYFLRYLLDRGGFLTAVEAGIAALLARVFTAGAGLTGGGDLSADRTFAVGAGTGITVNADDVALEDTAVTPGSYTNADITVDQQGRITAAANGSSGSGAFGGGAMVKKSVDATGLNVTTAAAVAWDAEEYDTDSIHDNATNNTRLTVPAGITKVKVGYALQFANVGSSNYMSALLKKNGSFEFIGNPGQSGDISTTTSPRLSASSGALSVTDGDYFEVFIISESDTSIDISSTRSAFWMELVE